MNQVTLLFLLKDNQILLAMKKRGFGVGKWNGVGGKPKDNEDILDTAIRETQEEINVTPENFSHVATINFHFKNKPEWDQQVLVFTTHEWKGEPSESEEMNPKWFNINNLPFESMWADDPFWLPQILSGKKINASFTFGDNDIILSKEIHEI
jgi:ADP-ribose pyrophosphatase YjhB (NUDIX family)